MLWNFYDGVDRAAGDLHRRVGAISTTFAPMDSTLLTPAVIIDMVTLGFVSTAAPFWNSWIKRLPIMENN